MTVVSHVTQIGSIKAPEYDVDLALDAFADVDASPVRCLDAEASQDDGRRDQRPAQANESIGGIFELRAFGLVPGPRLARELGAAARRADRDGAA